MDFCHNDIPGSFVSNNQHPTPRCITGHMSRYEYRNVRNEFSRCRRVDVKKEAGNWPVLTWVLLLRADRYGTFFNLLESNTYRDCSFEYNGQSACVLLVNNNRLIAIDCNADCFCSKAFWVLRGRFSSIFRVFWHSSIVRHLDEPIRRVFCI